jgi:hypothetical protein
MSRRHPGLSFVLGLSVVSLLAQPGRAQQPEASAGAAEHSPPPDAAEHSAAPDAASIAAAEAQASAAYEAYLRKEYVRAVALYEQALAAAPNAALVLYNIARIYDVGLHSRGLAIDYYHRFIAAPGAPPTHILNARARIAELEIAERAAVNQTVATKAMAPSELGESEAAAPVSPAASELSAPATPLERLPVAPGIDTPMQAPADESTWTSRRVAALAVGGAGVASVGLGIGFLFSARAKSDVWKRDCNGNDCSTQRAVNAAESASRQVAIGTAGLFAGGALIALGGVFWFVDFSSGKPAEGSVASAASSWSFSPALSSSEIGAELSTRF